MSTPKSFEYSVAERSGTPAHAEPDWTAEHLLLAGLARCSLSSLEYFGKRVNVEASGTADADGVELVKLLDSAEYGCFIGASLTATPTYEWRVNGKAVR